MLAFIIALLFGIGQILLTEKLIKYVNCYEKKSIFKFFAIKFALYGIGIGIVVLKFVWYLGAIICGFVVGCSVSAILLFIYRTIYKK